jgi:hypothetical protein
MRNHTLNFGQLRAKLKELGFIEYRVEHDGKRGRLFEREVAPTASIFLPERDDNATVESFDMNSVLMILRSRGLIEQENPLLT